MSSKQIVFERKMQFLIKIRENRHILFGAFSDKLRKQDEVEKWKEMGNLAQSLVPADKDWTYVRDTLWQNLKKTAMTEIDNAKKTGTGGMGNLTEMDKIVLKIIGKDSPVICGLGVAESFQKPKQPSRETVVENNNAEDIANKSGPISAHETPSIPMKKKRDRANNSDSEKVAQIKQEKLALQVKYLRLNNHKTKLEIVSLEQELKLPMSEFTAALPQYNEDENGCCFYNLL